MSKRGSKNATRLSRILEYINGFLKKKSKRDNEGRKSKFGKRKKSKVKKHTPRPKGKPKDVSNKNHKNEYVDINSIITIQYINGSRVKVILKSDDEDFEKSPEIKEVIVRCRSPLGVALMNKKVGDIEKVEGPETRFEVIQIENN